MEERDRYHRTAIYGAGLSSGNGRQLGGRMIFGFALVSLGVLWTLDNLNVLDASQVTHWWPVLLVLFGLMKITGIGADKATVPGGIFTVIGSLLVVDRLHLINFSVRDAWPLALVAIGIGVVYRSMRGPEAAGNEDGDSFVRSFALMGGVVRRNRSEAFRGGDLSAMMGAVELDLREAQLDNGRAVVEVFAMWGGIEIIVPPDWRVESEVTPIMAGFEDNTRLTPGAEIAGTLVVRGFGVMGGIEVKNHKDDREPRVRVRRRDTAVEVKTSSGKTVSIGVTYPKHDDDQSRPVN